MSTRRLLRGAVGNIQQQIYVARNAGAGDAVISPLIEKHIQLHTALANSDENENVDARINTDVNDFIKSILYLHRIRSSEKLPVALRSAIVRIRRDLLDGNVVPIDAIFSVFPQEILKAYSMFLEPIQVALKRKFPNGIDKYDLFFLVKEGDKFVTDALGYEPGPRTVLSRIPGVTAKLRAGRNGFRYSKLGYNSIKANMDSILKNNVPPGPELDAAAGAGGLGNLARVNNGRAVSQPNNNSNGTNGNNGLDPGVYYNNSGRLIGILASFSRRNPGLITYPTISFTNGPANRRNSTNSNNSAAEAVPHPELTLQIPRAALANSNGFFKRLKKTFKKKRSPFTNK